MEIGNGRYRLIRRLGSGGVGAVYQAADTLLGRTVAVKALHPSLTVDLLRREGQSLAQLTHPNVVALYDLIEDGGQPYLIMEYVEGGSLEEWLHDHGALNWEQGLQIFRPIAAAVAQAHARGLLHCDLKPANVLISSTGEIKLTDFTLARLEHEGRFDGVRGASAVYAAPEQAAGEDVDRRTDVYGLGVLLTRLLGPLDSTQSVEAQIAATLARATAAAPEHRFSTVDELLAALPPADAGSTAIVARTGVSDLTRVALSPAPSPAPRRRAFVSWRLLVAPLALVVAAGAFFTHFTASASPTLIRLPDLVATQGPSANLVLRSLELRERTVAVYSGAPQGIVVAQRPGAADRVSRGEVITLFLSKGPRPVMLPDVQGLTQAQALVRLHTLGFKVSVKTSETVFHSAGEVLSQAPDPHSLQRPGTVIVLTVATKPWWWVF
jgi:serine/threonine protein kinase